MKIALSNVTNGQNISAINNNFQLIANALNTQVLYRANPVGEPNEIEGTLDFNQNNAINLKETHTANLYINGVLVVPQDVAIANTLKTYNNLSDVASISTALVNLGLDQVNNTSDLNKPISTATQTALNGKINTSTVIDVAHGGTGATTVGAALTALSLDQVNNTSDLNKPVSTATQTALNLKAPLASPALTGVPTAPTAAVNTNTTQLATTAYVMGQGYATLASPTFTGIVTIPSGASIAGYLTTSSAASTYAPIASPTFTGTPATVTPSTADNSTKIASTAYVQAQGYLTSSSAASTYLPLAGGTLTGEVQRNGAVATLRTWGIQTAGVQRWRYGAGSAPESGANAGTDFVLINYADDGSFLNTPLVITRATGAAAFSSTATATNLVVSGASATTATGNIAIGKTTQTTVGAAGGASAMPTPLGYIVAYLGTTKIAIPYFNG